MNTSILLVLSLFFAACGGSQKPAEEPEAEAAAAEEEAGAAAPEASEAPEAEEGKDVKEAKEAKEPADSSTSGPTFKRTAKDIVTAPDVIFMFSFNESDVRAKAEEHCDGRAKDDPKKRADCMSKEKTKIDSDGMQFKLEKDRWYWLTLRRKGKTLVSLHKIPIEFKDETDNSIVLKPVGKDEGTLRGRGAPGETKVEVPNDYQIILNDSKHGKMVYEAKVGLIGDQPR